MGYIILIIIINYCLFEAFIKASKGHYFFEGSKSGLNTFKRDLVRGCKEQPQLIVYKEGLETYYLKVIKIDESQTKVNNSSWGSVRVLK